MLHCHRDVGIPSWEKNDFSRLNFTFYSILEKTFLSAIIEKTTNTVPAHTSNSCLPVGQPVIRMLHTPHWLTNCARAEQILLNRLAKNIANCVIMIYITLHYITLHYSTLWSVSEIFFPYTIFLRLYNLPPRQAIWSSRRPDSLAITF